MYSECINSLNELELKIDELRAELEENKKNTVSVISPLLFRGHASSKWNLDTTLERHDHRKYSIVNYDNQLWVIHSAVVSYTGKKWSLDEVKIDDSRFIRPPNYEFMAYVRHHGFPTPLLDWTRSLYVALFFSYQKAN